MNDRDREDEERERQRQAKEREKWTLAERIKGSPNVITDSGFVSGQSKRRTLRVVPMLLRLHPRIKAIVEAILERDGIPSLVVFFEIMLDTYQRVHGPIDQSLLPSDEELVRRLEEARAKRERDE